MINIESIRIGLPQVDGVSVLIRPLINSTTDTSCSAEYEVYSENKEIIAKGTTLISEEEYEKWAEDNTVFEDIVLDHIGLKRAVISETENQIVP